MFRTQAQSILRKFSLVGGTAARLASRRTVTTGKSKAGGGDRNRNLSSAVNVRTDSSATYVNGDTTHSLETLRSGNKQITFPSRKRTHPITLTLPPQPPPKAELEAELSATTEELREQNLAEEEPFESPTHLSYVGGDPMPITSRADIIEPGDDVPRGIWPVFRLLDEDGRFRCPSKDCYFDPSSSVSTTLSSPTSSINGAAVIPNNSKQDLAALQKKLSLDHPFHASEVRDSILLRPCNQPFPDTDTDNTLLRAHRLMIRLREMDEILQNSQRQGRISFYLTCRGEEAIHMGSASALEPRDVILAQYREQGLLMWRGFTLEQFTNQCFSNDLDLGRGRQMPIHYGSRALNYHTISSPLGTQIPQAVGVAYKMKMDALAEASAANKEAGGASPPSSKESAVAICYFGEGCSSTTDFHAGLNFAATLRVPAIFFVRNNGFAISTSSSGQYAGDGIAPRAPGYGMAGIRVDGNDVFAVNAAVRDARKYCVRHSAPVLIEAMTYRQGHHSTSDDSSRYRCPNEVLRQSALTDPVRRLDKFLDMQGWLTPDDIATIRDEERVAVLEAMEAAERRPPPKLDTMFQDVYHEVPAHLQRQEQELKLHLAKYPGRYQSMPH